MCGGVVSAKCKVQSVKGVKVGCLQRTVLKREGVKREEGTDKILRATFQPFNL